MIRSAIPAGLGGLIAGLMIRIKQEEQIEGRKWLGKVEALSTL